MGSCGKAEMDLPHRILRKSMEWHSSARCCFLLLFFCVFFIISEIIHIRVTSGLPDKVYKGNICTSR